MSEDAAQGDWWFNLRTQTVEHGPGSAAKDRMGPYATRADAEHALDRARERNEAWRRADDDDD